MDNNDELSTNTKRMPTKRKIIRSDVDGLADFYFVDNSVDECIVLCSLVYGVTISSRLEEQR